MRELRGMKQEALAITLGVSQQTVSNLEKSAEIDDKRLSEIAEALGVSAEAIRNFSEENGINYFNTFNDSSAAQAFGHIYNFNPIDKLVELFDENKKLYERLLETEREKLSYLERLLKQFEK